MKKILIIEDEEYIRSGAALLLEDQGFLTITAEDGEIGIEKALSEKPDLILCDVMMPNVDGYGVIFRLRQEPTTANIPFIFLTAKVDRSSVRMGMDMGADDYLTKPFTLDELVGAVNTRLEKQARQAQEAEEKLETLRRNVIYALPHELMTPLNGILGPSELLIQMFDMLSKEEIIEMLGIIRKSGDRLYHLMQNYLLYAQLDLFLGDDEAIKMMRNGLTPEAHVVIESASVSKAADYNRKADLQLQCGGGDVKINQEHLHKIIIELIDNAFKFSPEGSFIEVRGKQNEGFYQITITDGGRGMKPEEIASIGGYMQFDRRMYEQQGGGFGLIIAKRLVEIHGGEFSIDSVPHVKTTVQFSIPLKTA
ncbi:MAG: response regulator [Bacteroidetes bacterium]|nr:response regulator [Bacteroidota bacterium]